MQLAPPARSARNVLIVAIGARPLVPDIPGISEPGVMYAVDTYWEPEKVGSAVVVIGGGLVGCETGLHLAALGKSVTLVEMMGNLAPDATESHRIALFGMMDRADITCHTETRCAGITASGVQVVSKNGAEQQIEADTVVYAVGLKARLDGALELCTAAPRQYFLVGDGINPRKVKQAVHEGHHAAMDVI